MNLPQYPTDSLYKFMAITGLLLFLSGYYLYWIKYSELNLSIIDTTTEVKTLESDQDYLITDQDILIYDSNNLKNKVKEYKQYVSKGIQPKMEVVNSYENDIKTIELKNETIAKLANEYKKAGIKLDGSIEKLRLKTEELRWIAIEIFVTSFFGVILSISGFTLWYIRLQKPIDKKMSKFK